MGVIAVLAAIIQQPQSVMHDTAPAVPTFVAMPVVVEREREGIMNEEEDYARFQHELERRVGVFTQIDQKRLYKTWRKNREDLAGLERWYE